MWSDNDIDMLLKFLWLVLTSMSTVVIELKFSRLEHILLSVWTIVAHTTIISIWNTNHLLSDGHD